jgi:TM2 domain-containing membrane protein YozV
MLGIFLGFLGVHNFYAGYTRIAILQVVLTGLAALLGFNLIITWVWALVEVLFVHTDPRGARLA